MNTRRQFFAIIFATLVIAPLIKLGWMKAPARRIVVSPKQMSMIVDGMKGLFCNSAAIRQQYSKGCVGKLGGFERYMDPKRGSDSPIQLDEYWGTQRITWDAADFGCMPSRKKAA